MNKLPLEINNLGELNEGAFGREVNLELLKGVEHCFTHPMLEGKRKITLEIELETKFDNLGNHYIEITPSVKLTTPKAKGRTEAISASYRDRKVEAHIIAGHQEDLFSAEGGN